MCYICHHQPTSLTFSIKKTEVPGSIDIVKLNRKKQANLISPVKASPFPTQEFWAEVSILFEIEFFTWSMYTKGGATTTSVLLTKIKRIRKQDKNITARIATVIIGVVNSNR